MQNKDFDQYDRFENSNLNQETSNKTNKFNPLDRKVVSAQDGVMFKQIPESNSRIKNNRLKLIEEQKRKLLDKLNIIQKQPNSEVKEESNYEQNIKKLLQKKKKMQEQNQKTLKLQKQIQQRQKIAFLKKKNIKQFDIQNIKKQKESLQDQIAKKKIITDVITNHTKTLNDQDLLQRALKRQVISDQVIKQFPNYPKADIRIKIDNKISNEQEYKKIIQQIQSRKTTVQRPKTDITKLNNKRLQIFQKQQRLLKRKIVLKQMQAQGPEYFDKAYQMTNEQIESVLQVLGHQVDDFRHPIPAEMILDNLQNINAKTKQRINQLKQSKQGQQTYEYRGQLKPLISRFDKQSVTIIQLIINQVIMKSIDYYQKFIKQFNSLEDRRKAYQQYTIKFMKKQEEQQKQSLSNLITDQLLEKITLQMQKQSVDQIYALHKLAWTKTFNLIKPFLNNKNDENLLKITSQYDVELQYTKGKTKLKYKNKTQGNKQTGSNVFQGTRDTKQLLNDIQLLQEQETYFKKIKTSIQKMNEQFKEHENIYYDKQLFLIFDNSIKNVSSQYSLDLPKSQSKFIIKKFNSYWLLFNHQCIYIINQWFNQTFSQHIGDTVSSTNGNISYVQFYPITTLLGSLCSIFIGFINGNILKYNFNRNPITRKQTNLSWFQPLIPHVQTGQQPNLPPQHKNLIQFTSQKVKPNTRIHEYRQFIHHHKRHIVCIQFYSANGFITLDEFLEGALWQYQSSTNKQIQPLYKFEIKMNIKGYRYHENPRLKIMEIKKTPEQEYLYFFENENILKKQIYNNPKKLEAIYRQEQGQKKDQIPLIKINYNLIKKRVQKKYQEIYVEKQIQAKAKNGKIWNNNIFILTIRDHLIKQQLQTIKIIGWNIKNKKLRPIAYQIDIYQNQVIPQFFILDSILQKIQIPAVMILNTGRILIFSLITGQLLRNITDPQYLIDASTSKLLFKFVTNKQELIIGSNKKQLYNIKLEDNNQQSSAFNFQKLYSNNLLKYLE